MKKYIFTEAQIKKVIDNVVTEQKINSMSAEDRLAKQNQDGFDAVWNNPPISKQMSKVKPGPNGKYCFSRKKLAELDQDKTNRLYLVQKGDTISQLVNKLGANSDYNIFASNDLLMNKPQNLRVGDVIAYSLAPSGA